MDKIFCHSSEKMPELENNSISLTVTSPPYWNAIDYDVHSKNKNEYYRTRKYKNGFSDYDEYIDWISKIFTEVLKVTKGGGFCAIVIGTVLFESKHFPVPFDITSRLSKEGWDFHQDIIWHKTTAGVKRAGVSIQKPYPGYFYPNIMSEYILIFRKPGDPIYSKRDPIKKEDAKFPINKLFTLDIANNIWHIAPVPPHYLDHPCPFPEEIPYRLISMYSYPNEIVLDPFSGSGQTLKVAKALDRRYIGYEIVQEYVSLSERRINEGLSIRSNQLIARFDKINLNEPLNQQYVTKEFDISIKKINKKENRQLQLEIRESTKDE